MKKAPAKTVEEYLAALPRDVRIALQDLRNAIKAAAPMAQESISYRLPAYKHHGWVVFFAAFKDHCSLIVASESIVRKYSRELRSFDTSGTTIHFTAKNPLPPTLVKKIVRARIAENESRFRQKTKRN